MNICSCGCGFKIGSLEFIRLHVETEQEQIQREASEQYAAEQEAMREYYEQRNSGHSPGSCFCTEHWGQK